MRRADRLFDIIQILRRGALIRARDIADELEVSKRTIYRDIAALTASGLPIEGEAGVGYVLRDSVDLPPLMFDEDEIDALVVGARMVESWADAGLARAAASAQRKIAAAVPDRLRAVMAEVPIDAPRNHWQEPITICRGVLRRSIRGREKLHVVYRAKSGERTGRLVRPLLLSFFGSIWNLTTWCELRGDFRTFRIDHIESAETTGVVFADEPGKRLADLMARAPDQR